MQRSLQGDLWEDSELDDGYLVVVRAHREVVYMSVVTYHAISHAGALGRLWDFAESGVEGMFLLPRSVIEPDAAEDLRRGLAFVDPEPSDACIYPPCSLPAEVEHEGGFWLCSHHAELMSGWDDLVA